VVWEGPDAQGDYVTMVPDGTPEGEYLEWASTADGNPVTLTAPPEPGAYEVRYVSGDGDRTLGRTLVSVLGIEVSLDAPPDVDGGLRFAVSWTGPNGPGDYVAIAPEGSREGRYLDWAYTTAGSALTLAAPRKSGVYEVRYVRGRDARTLARVVVNVR